MAKETNSELSFENSELTSLRKLKELSCINQIVGILKENKSKGEIRKINNVDYNGTNLKLICWDDVNKKFLDLLFLKSFIEIPGEVSVIP